MVCKKCGAETLDGALFCGSCGTRLDGKKPCVACNKLNDENNAYCIYCGTRIDGKKVCVSCGTAYEGKFCPNCGHGDEREKSKNPTDVSRGEEEYRDKKWSLKRILSFTASCLGILGVLFALTFVFFIGAKAEVIGNEISTGKTKMNLFYFFGGFFKEAKAELAVSGAGLLGYMTKFSIYTYGALGLTVTIVTLVLVVTFATIAIVKFIMNILGKSNQSADKWSVLTIGSFFFGAGAFYGLHKFTLDLTASASSISASIPAGIALNGATKAGVILCAILLGLFVVCKIVAKGKALLKANAIVKLVLSVVGVALSTVVFICLGNSGVAHSLTEIGTGNAVVADLKMKGGFTFFLLGYGVEFLAEFTDLTQVDMINDAQTAVVFGNLAQIMLTVALVFVVLSLCYKLLVTAEDKAHAGLVWAILAFVLAVTVLVFALISTGAMESVYEMSLLLEGNTGLEATGLTTVEFKTAGIIVALVFATLNLGLTIAQAVLNRMAKKRENSDY